MAFDLDASRLGHMILNWTGSEQAPPNLHMPTARSRELVLGHPELVDDEPIHRDVN